MKLGLALCLLLASACACRDRETHAPGATDDECTRACVILRSAGCNAGLSPSCVLACERDQAQGVGAQLDVACVLDAGANVSLLCRCNVGACTAGGGGPP